MSIREIKIRDLLTKICDYFSILVESSHSQEFLLAFKQHENIIQTRDSCD